MVCVIAHMNQFIDQCCMPLGIYDEFFYFSESWAHSHFFNVLSFLQIVFFRSRAVRFDRLLMSMPFVHTVCETGFNAGHSAFNYLTANPRLVMHSFELGQYGYSARVAQNLSEMFPGRFVYHVGDSCKSVPEFIAKNPSVKCSLISVDGGHVYPVALADALNLASVADIENGAIIAFDDYPSPNNHGPAWDYVVKLGYVEEVSFCRFTHKGGLRHAPGFAFGIVVNRPNSTSLKSLLKKQ
jgi:hypothetical protein